MLLGCIILFQALHKMIMSEKMLRFYTTSAVELLSVNSFLPNYEFLNCGNEYLIVVFDKISIS